MPLFTDSGALLSRCCRTQPCVSLVVKRGRRTRWIRRRRSLASRSWSAPSATRSSTPAALRFVPLTGSEASEQARLKVTLPINCLSSDGQV